MLSTTTQDWLDLARGMCSYNIIVPHQSPVGVIEDLLDLETLGGLGEANLHTGCWY